MAHHVCMRKEYQRLGYRDAWINGRLMNVVIRNKLTEEWRNRGADEGRDLFPAPKI